MLQPTVTIAGQEIADSWSGGVCALAGIRIEWGREGLYDQPNPTRARLILIDPTGTTVGDPGLYQQTVKITRPAASGGAARIAFTGRIDEIVVRREYLTDPRTGRRVMVWRGELSATDLLAQLAKIVKPGFAGLYLYPTDPINIQNSEAFSQEYGPGYWEAAGGSTRRAEIEQRAAEAGLTIHTQAMPLPADIYTSSASMRVKRATVSLFDLLAEMYQSQPFGHIRYDPNADTIGPGNFTPPVTLALTYANDEISMTFDAASPGYSVDAGSVVVAEDAGISSTVGHNITSIRFDYGYVGPGSKQYKTKATTSSSPDGVFWGAIPTVDQQDEKPISGTIGGPNQLEVTFPAQAAGGYDSDTFRTKWANAAAPIIRELNGKLYAPPVVFDLARFDYPAAVIDDLLSPVAPLLPFSFPGAVFAALPGFGPVFQLIGATLDYDGTDWRVTGVFAPARSAATANPVTYAAPNPWVSNAVAEYQDFAASISYADLASVSKGAA